MTEPINETRHNPAKSNAPNYPRRPRQILLRILREIFTTQRGWWLICICFATIAVWSARHQIITDGLSYLDIASEASDGNLAALGNSYWSPAYPALIGAALYFIRPSAANEVPVLQAVNFVIYLMTLGAFSFFFHHWTRTIPELRQASSTSRGLFTLFAFASFLWFTDSLIVIPFPTPDMMVAAIVFFVAAMGCRLSRPGAGWKHFIALGTTLGFGIYVKAALFPLGFEFIVLLFLSLAWKPAIPRRKLLACFAITTAMWAIVAAPLFVSMSVRDARLTTGDAAKLNYLWNVDKFEPDHVGWSGGTAPEYGTPLHAPRKLMENPAVLEFARPSAETYPLWHSPGYWYAGAKPVFNLRKQMNALWESLLECMVIAGRAIGFIAGAFALFVLGMMKSKRAEPWRASFWMLAWPLAACVMYAAVRLHPRYVAAFLVLLCLEIFRALVFRVEKRVAIGVCAIALLISMTPLTFRTARALVTSVSRFRHPVDEDYVVAARNLQNLGLRPGDKVAVVGYALNCSYARYDRLRIVSQILAPDDFWRLNATEAKRVDDRLASIGVKALIAFKQPGSTQEDHSAGKQNAGWTQVGSFAGGSLSAHLIKLESDSAHLQSAALPDEIASKSGTHSSVVAVDGSPQADTRHSDEE